MCGNPPEVQFSLAHFNSVLMLIARYYTGYMAVMASKARCCGYYSSLLRWEAMVQTVMGLPLKVLRDEENGAAFSTSLKFMITLTSPRLHQMPICKFIHIIQ